MEREERPVLQRGHERFDLVGERHGVDQQRQRHGERDEADGADLVAPGEQRVAQRDRGGERDAELEEVAPRAAAHDGRPHRQREREQHDRGPREADRERSRGGAEFRSLRTRRLALHE